jgi:low temperature requirement protein LtrA
VSDIGSTNGAIGTLPKVPPARARYLGAGHTFRLEPPRLRTTGDANEDRHATWFELFFDLVFVAAIVQLGSALARDPSVGGFARFAGLFVVVTWAWILYTLYANRLDTDDLIFRLAKSGAMLAILVIAVNIHRIMEGAGGAVGFAIAYVVLRLLLAMLYVRARHHLAGDGRRLSDVYIVGYSGTTSLWVASIFVSGPGRYVLWGAAMLIDLLIPIRAWATLGQHTVVVSHLTERFGTFFIIVLGQSLVAVVAGVAGLEFTLESWLIGGGCFLVALCLWWIYFDLADTSVVGRGALGLVFVYSHFPLLAGVTAFGVGTRLAIAAASNGGLAPGTRWAMAGGVGAFALSLAVIHIGAEWTSMSDRSFVARICVVVFMLALAAGGGGLEPLAFVAIVAAVLLAQLLLEAFTVPAGAATIYDPHAPTGLRTRLEA